jgi:hypothetical protein
MDTALTRQPSYPGSGKPEPPNGLYWALSCLFDTKGAIFLGQPQFLTTSTFSQRLYI